MMTSSSNAAVFLGITAVLTLGLGQRSADAETIRGCRNPAGQVRLVGDTESCRSQETLVEWDSEGAQGPEGPQGPAGPKGDTGDPGADAQGTVGGGDHSLPGQAGMTFLTGTSTPLTTGNIGTGFPTYMVWANVGLEFNSGNPVGGSLPSPSGANCQLVYTVTGRTGTFFIDGRAVTFPVQTIGENNQPVRLSLALTGLIGRDLTPALNPSEVVDVTLNCSSNATPAANQIPVKALNFSLTGIGINEIFQP